MENKRKLTLFMGTLLLSLLIFIGFNQSINAETIVENDDNGIETITEIKEVSKEQLILELSKNSNITKEAARTALFPTNNRLKRSLTDEESSTFAVISVRLNDRTIENSVEGGTAYFYCSTDESGWFRAIKNIIYAGYNHPSLGFNGTLQYHLPDPNRIHYTLNGNFYYHATTSVQGGASIGVGGSATLNIGGSVTSNFAKSVLVHRDITF